MRLWSIHPCHLDRQGLIALWSEGLLGLAVLQGKTKGYKNHPQLDRFKAQENPVYSLTHYLEFVAREMQRRGYKPSMDKLPPIPAHLYMHKMKVTFGQLGFEAEHLLSKFKRRAPELLLNGAPLVVTAHPMMTVVRGGVESWEKLKEGK